MIFFGNMFFLAIQCHLCERCLFITYFCISIYIIEASDQLCTLICWGASGGARMGWALCWTEPASLREIFVLPTSQTPQEGLCRPKKSHYVSNILPVFGRLDRHCLADLDFFESPGLYTVCVGRTLVQEKCGFETFLFETLRRSIWKTLEWKN